MSSETADGAGERTSDGGAAADDVDAGDVADASDAVAVPADSPVILFDGVCNLCNGLVQFVIPRDPDATFRFASLQSEAGQALLERFDLPTDDFESFVLVEGDEYYTKSAAALRIAKQLGGAYALLYAFVVVPRPLRDRVYEFVADHRYEWFGKKDQCMLPPPDVESRFLGERTR